MAFVSFSRCSREVRSSAGAPGGFDLGAAAAAGAVEDVPEAGAPAVDGVADFGCSDLLAAGGFCLGAPAVGDCALASLAGGAGRGAGPPLAALAAGFDADWSTVDGRAEVDDGGVAVLGDVLPVPVA